MSRRSATACARALLIVARAPSNTRRARGRTRWGGCARWGHWRGACSERRDGRGACRARRPLWCGTEACPTFGTGSAHIHQAADSAFMHARQPALERTAQPASTHVYGYSGSVPLPWWKPRCTRTGGNLAALAHAALVRLQTRSLHLRDTLLHASRAERECLPHLTAAPLRRLRACQHPGERRGRPGYMLRWRPFTCGRHLQRHVNARQLARPDHARTHLTARR